MRMVKLGEVAEINPRGDSAPRGVLSSFVGMAQLNPDLAVATPLEERVFDDGGKGFTVFRDSDILAAKITPCWENGKVGQAILASSIGVGSTEFHIVRPGVELHSRFCLHYLRQRSVRLAGEQRMTGSAGQKRVPTNFLMGLPIPLPPLAEQRRIAAILDQADSIRAKRRKVLAHYDDLERAAFRMSFGDPADWPRLWSMGTIGDLALSVNYGSSQRAGAIGKWPMLRMGNITDDGRVDLGDLKYVDLSDDDVAKYTTSQGDMLFNRTNSREKVGKAAVVRGDEQLAIAGYLVRVRFSSASVAEFVSAYLRSEHGRALRLKLAKAAVNQANINASELRAIPIAHPPQRELSDFENSLSRLNAQRATVERALAADDELFASLQSRAFRGEL